MDGSVSSDFAFRTLLGFGVFEILGCRDAAPSLKPQKPILSPQGTLKLPVPECKP